MSKLLSVAAVIATVLIVATTGFTLGREVQERSARVEMAVQAARLDALQRDLALLALRTPSPTATSGTHDTAALVEEVPARVERDLGLVSPQMLRDRRGSFVELYATERGGATAYGTAGYL